MPYRAVSLRIRVLPDCFYSVNEAICPISRILLRNSNALWVSELRCVVVNEWHLFTETGIDGFCFRKIRHLKFICTFAVRT